MSTTNPTNNAAAHCAQVVDWAPVHARLHTGDVSGWLPQLLQRCPHCIEAA